MMMERPLRIADILAFAAEVHPSGEIVSARSEGDVHRVTYRDAARRVAQLAHGLRALGVRQGERVATLAFNGHRHFELYYAVSGIGAVCHTINPRLSQAELAFIVGHAGDGLLFVDLPLVPLVEALVPLLARPPRLAVMTDRAHMPEAALDLLCFEEILEGRPDTIDWPQFPETTAAGLCYTSGTTGVPKGALYSHRSTVLHALFLATSLPGSLRERRRILPAVPLFHVNAWGLPYTAPLTGASLVMPGQRLDGASLFDLMDREGVHSGWGVPTVWLGLLGEIDRRGRLPAGFCDVVIGGSAAPRPMIGRFEELGVNVCQAWGMTEMSPVGTQGNLPAHFDEAPREAQLAKKAQQGRRLFGVELRIVDEAGQPLPNDGRTVGALHARGNTVIAGYYGDEAASAAAFDADGWFITGDIAAIDDDGSLVIADRAKDMIKSGGEWISSIDLENAAMGHPGVANCAVIAVPHETWGERPLLIVVPAGEPPDTGDLRAHLAARFARWQLPDDVVFVQTLPLTATGKVAKRRLRETFSGHVLPGAAGEGPA